MLKLALLMIALTIQGAVADLTGRWTLELNPNFGGVAETRRCTLKQDANALALNCDGVEMAGSVEGQQVTFGLKTGPERELTATFTGTLNQTETMIDGTWSLPGNPAGYATGKFTLTR
jgi:hypothetical protein